jgi:hypothetical protein
MRFARFVEFLTRAVDLHLAELRFNHRNHIVYRAVSRCRLD